MDATSSWNVYYLVHVLLNPSSQNFTRKQAAAGRVGRDIFATCVDIAEDSELILQ